MDWARAASEFKWDGSLRDIYVLGTTAIDWQKTLDALRTSKFAPSFSINGKAADWPDSAVDVFKRRSEEGPLLALTVEGLTLNCHFFQDDEIEFDLDPREVTGPAQLNALATFMRFLADRTGKVAILTHENLRGAIILSSSP